MKELDKATTIITTTITGCGYGIPASPRNIVTTITGCGMVRNQADYDAQLNRFRHPKKRLWWW
jgi:hypothetical protein